jgi:glycosyltransferase involved in cell wall biosynthesis/predicted SAM-dependent methyltransferase
MGEGKMTTGQPLSITVPWQTGATVLEIGGGDIPLFRPNMDMRKLPTVDIVADLEGNWPIPDATYNGIFGKFVIEHMSWRAIPHFASECFRILKPGGAVMMVGPNTLEQCAEITRRGRITKEESAMLFGGQEERGWNEHKAAFSPAYAIEIFKAAGFTRVETEDWPIAKTDMIIRAWKDAGAVAPAPSYPAGYDMMQQDWFLKLKNSVNPQPAMVTQPPTANKKAGMNIGSFTVMVNDSATTDWLNTDILDMSQYAREKGFRFQQFDATKGIPWPENTADFIVASHFLEHITRAEANSFLKECLRVLKPKGVLRIAVPDLDTLTYSYADDEDDSFSGKFKDNEGVKNAEDDAEAFWNMLTNGHKTAYNDQAVIGKLDKAGFAHSKLFNEGESYAREIIDDTVDMYPDHSCYVEGIKGALGETPPFFRKEKSKAAISFGFRSGLAANITSALKILTKEEPAQPNLPKAEPVSLLSTSGFDDSTLSRLKQYAQKQLRIGLISTPFFGCPPKGYSGLEQIVWDLALGLIHQGHFVRLFAPEGSLVPPGGELVTTGPALMNVQVDWLKEERDDYEIYKSRLADLDILHGHDWFGVEYLCRPSFSAVYGNKLKICHTHHGHLNPDWWLKTKSPLPLNFIAISQHMMNEYAAQGMPSRYVYNGIDMNRYQYQEKKGNRLLFVGRFDTFKQPHVAIELAKRTGLGLDLVGGTFVQDQNYLAQIKAAADGKQICFYPDVSQEEKVKFYQNAKAVIFPSKMGEPFGLIVPEANACGTPVIGFRDGAIPETITDGFNGFLASTIEEMQQAVLLLDKISPADCRLSVERRFTRNVMARGYEMLYREMISGVEW